MNLLFWKKKKKPDPQLEQKTLEIQAYRSKMIKQILTLHIDRLATQYATNRPPRFRVGDRVVPDYYNINGMARNNWDAGVTMFEDSAPDEDTSPDLLTITEVRLEKELALQIMQTFIDNYAHIYEDTDSLHACRETVLVARYTDWIERMDGHYNELTLKSPYGLYHSVIYENEVFNHILTGLHEDVFLKKGTDAYRFTVERRRKETRRRKREFRLRLEHETAREELARFRLENHSLSQAFTQTATCT